jgi:hypothetical protein
MTSKEKDLTQIEVYELAELQSSFRHIVNPLKFAKSKFIVWLQLDSHRHDKDKKLANRGTIKKKQFYAAISWKSLYFRPFVLCPVAIAHNERQ